MAKKTTETAVEDFTPLPTPTANPFGNEFENEFEGDESNTINKSVVQQKNPYAGNAEEIARGGYAIPLVQYGVTDPTILFNIGNQATMVNSKGTEYEAYVAKEMEICILGGTPNYWVLNQSLFKDRAFEVVLARETFLGNVKKIDKDGTSKAVSNSKKTIFFLIRGDASRRLYSMSCRGNASAALEAVHKTVKEMCQDYRNFQAKDAGKKPQEVKVKGTHLFWVKLGVAKPFDPSGKGSFITPPELKWKNGKRPLTLEELLQYRVTGDEYQEFTEYAITVADHLKSEKYQPGAILPEILDEIGFTQTLDDKMIAAPISANQIAAPRKSFTPAISAPAASTVVDAPSVSFDKWLSMAGNTVGKLETMFSENGVTGAQVLKSMGVADYKSIPLPIVDAITVTLDDNQ